MTTKEQDIDYSKKVSTCRNIGISYSEGEKYFGSMFDKIISALNNIENNFINAFGEES